MNGKLDPLTFRPRARLPRQLGEGLITDEIAAVYELVKNAYDADAREIAIALPRVDSPFAGTIVIKDDGHGMSYDDIRSRWMEPGTDGKRQARVSPGGRTMLGEKGIGRFAADKLAASLRLSSKKTGADSWVHVSFDWDRFTAAEYLDEIRVEAWETPANDPADHGTCLTMSSLRSVWTRRRVEALILQLRGLFPPGAEVSDVKISVACEGCGDVAGELRPLDLEDATSRVVVSIDEDGHVERVTDGRVESIKGTPLDCGWLQLRLYYFDPSARRMWAQRTSVKWEEWAGIRLYRDGVRVLPFGRPGNDWLGLNEQQAKKHTNLAVRDLLGCVLISKEGNPDLIDTTSREGLLDNDAFSAMLQFVREEVDHFGDHVTYLKNQQKEDPVGKDGKEHGIPTGDPPATVQGTPKPSDKHPKGSEPPAEPPYAPVSPPPKADPPAPPLVSRPGRREIPVDVGQLTAIRDCVSSARMANETRDPAKTEQWLRAAEDHLIAVFNAPGFARSK